MIIKLNLVLDFLGTTNKSVHETGSLEMYGWVSTDVMSGEILRRTCMTRSTVGTSIADRIRSASSIGRSKKGKTDMIETSRL